MSARDNESLEQGRRVEGEIMVLVIHAKTIARILVVTVLLITLASLAVRFLQYVEYGPVSSAVRALVDVGEEDNLPTWYSAVQLQLSSILLATIAIAKRRHRDGYALHWAILSSIFLYLSLDEVASQHEELSHGVIPSLGRDLLDLDSGFFYQFWVVPGTIFTLVFLLAYLRFLAHLPRDTRRLFVLAGILFVLGALGAEMLSARVISSYEMEGWANVGGLPKITVGILGSLEELFEMLGIVVFIYALLSYMSSHVPGVTLRVRIDRP
jgi:hypothetical protein